MKNYLQYFSGGGGSRTLVRSYDPKDLYKRSLSFNFILENSDKQDYSKTIRSKVSSPLP